MAWLFHLIPPLCPWRHHGTHQHGIHFQTLEEKEGNRKQSIWLYQEQTMLDQSDCLLWWNGYVNEGRAGDTANKAFDIIFNHIPILEAEEVWNWSMISKNGLDEKLAVLLKSNGSDQGLDVWLAASEKRRKPGFDTGAHTIQFLHEQLGWWYTVHTDNDRQRWQQFHLEKEVGLHKLQRPLLTSISIIMWSKKTF